MRGKAVLIHNLTAALSSGAREARGLMANSDEASVVADDGINTEPALDHLEAALAPEMLAQTPYRGLVKAVALRAVPAGTGGAEALQ